MSDIEPIAFYPNSRIASMGHVVQSTYTPIYSNSVSFNRRELKQILDIYGRRVAAGEWRDYAIDMLRDKAVFSIFRRTSEIPIYRIEKSPKYSRRQGAYAVITATGLILKRGHDLRTVLRVLDKKLKPVEF